MADELVKVYSAASLGEAHLLREDLEEAGIQAFVEPTASPLDGLTAMGQGTDVMVRSDDTDAAAKIVEQFINEGRTEGE